MLARIWVHVGEVQVEPNDVHGLAVSDLYKVEQSTKRHVSAGSVALTKLARDVAFPALYPKQCELKPLEVAPLDGRESMKLYELVVKADVAFLISHQAKAAAQRATVLVKQ